MTVRELIVKLQCTQLDALVFVLDVDGCQTDIAGVASETQEDCSGDNHPVVYIATE